MKYAILMSGYMRSGLYNYNYFNEKIFKNIDYDLFIHLWDINEKGIQYSDKDILKLKNIYNPKTILIESYDLFKSQFNIKKPEWMTTGACIYENFCGQIYGLYKSNELKNNYLKKTNYKYNYLIRLRFDIKIFDYKLIQKKNIYNITNINDEIIYNIFTRMKKKYIILHDMFFIINDKISQIFFNDLFNYMLIDNNKLKKYSSNKTKNPKLKFYVEFLIIKHLIYLSKKI
jgi:hypothetical protein